MNFVGRCTESFHLFEHVSNTTQHGDGPVEILQEMFEVNHHVVDGFTELLFQPLLHRPAGQSTHGPCRLRYLPLQQGHDL